MVIPVAGQSILYIMSEPRKAGGFAIIIEDKTGLTKLAFGTDAVQVLDDPYEFAKINAENRRNNQRLWDYID